MRVLLVSHRFPPDGLGGVERYTQSLAARLVASGDDVSIVARRSQPGRKDLRLFRERLRDGASLFRIVTGDANFEQFLNNHEQLEQIFTMAAIETAPDIVHINHLMGLSPRFIQIAHRLGAAVVVSLHDFYFACPRVHLQKPTGDLCQGADHGHECVQTCFTAKPEEGRTRWALRSLYFRQALAMAERTVCYSDYVSTYFQRVLGVTPIQVIPNGVSLESSGCEGAVPFRAGRLRLAYCGTVAPHKGPHVILEALRAAKLEAVDFLVVGEVPDRECNEYAQRLRREAAAIPGLLFRMYGRYERQDLPILLRDVDCVVVPSLVPEAGPIVPREALAYGVPVIAARLGALPELINEGENGLTFDPRRPAELAGLLIRLATNENLHMRLRAGARRSSVVTIAEHARRIRAVYEQAIADYKMKPAVSTETAEFNALHKALLDLGCDSSLQRLDSGVTTPWN